MKGRRLGAAVVAAVALTVAAGAWAPASVLQAELHDDEAVAAVVRSQPALAPAVPRPSEQVALAAVAAGSLALIAAGRRLSHPFAPGRVGPMVGSRAAPTRGPPRFAS